MARRTLADDLVSDVSKTFINPEHFGTEVIRTAKDGSVLPINAIWQEDIVDRDIRDGERYVRTGVLVIASSETVERDDNWTIDDESDWVIATREGVGVVIHGARTIHLRRDEKKSTRKPATGLV